MVSSLKLGTSSEQEVFILKSRQVPGSEENSIQTCYLHTCSCRNTQRHTLIINLAAIFVRLVRMKRLPVKLCGMANDSSFVQPKNKPASSHMRRPIPSRASNLGWLCRKVQPGLIHMYGCESVTRTIIKALIVVTHDFGVCDEYYRLYLDVRLRLEASLA